MTWARRNAPDSQQAITDAYSSIGEESGALVVPASVALVAVPDGIPRAG
jgi:hypothetical protein